MQTAPSDDADQYRASNESASRDQSERWNGFNTDLDESIGSAPKGGEDQQQEQLYWCIWLFAGHPRLPLESRLGNGHLSVALAAMLRCRPNYELDKAGTPRMKSPEYIPDARGPLG